MKNIHVIQTDKPSRLHYWDGILKINNSDIPLGLLYQNIYITSDEEIKEGDWFISLYSNSIQRELKLDWTLNKDAYKKIILTTDQDLINDGVQAIDDEFLEWFVKNPSCEDVEVELFPKFSNKLYGIIIPKEEQKKPFYCSDRLELDENERCITQCDHCARKQPKIVQKLIDMMKEDEELGLYDIFNDEKRQGVKELIDKHTLEEASWKFNPLKKLDGEFLRHAFIQGAKWQEERMYSEEDMAESFMACWKANVPEGFECKLSFNEWFQQFKKK